MNLHTMIRSFSSPKADPGRYSYKGSRDPSGNKSGRGTILEKRGEHDVSEIFVGDFASGQPHGPCLKYVLPNGELFIGTMGQGKREGHGLLYDRDGPDRQLIYEGMWLDDKPHGYGQFYNHDGIYEGQWQKGYRDGKGTFIFGPDGVRKYEGDWKDDKPHGRGVYCGNEGEHSHLHLARGQLVAPANRGLCGEVPRGVAPSDISVQPAIFTAPRLAEAYWDLI